MFKKLLWQLTLSENQVPRPPEEYRGGHSEYRRFIICADRRTGSSLLVRLLDSHKSMHCFGEVFLESRTDFNKPGYDDRDEKVKWMRDAYPKAFLERCVFGAYTEDIDGVGFKIFPSQIQGRPELIGALNALRNVKIIHLSRKNYLESYVSLKMAQSTGNYGIKDPSKRSTKTLILDPKETEQAFTKLDDDYSWGKKFFSSSPSIEIDYQDLVLSRSETLAKVLSFIGVAKEELVTDKVKQEVRPMHEVIMNYAELKAYFSKTKWSGFFQDE